MKIVSHTEITAYNSCTLQHYFMYTLGLGPREKALNLYRGIVGHKALEAYYRRMQDGFPVEECRAIAIDVVFKEIDYITETAMWERDKLAELNRVAARLEAYAEVYRKEPFKVLAVEEVFVSEIYGDTSLGCVLDLLVEYTSGKFKGELAVIDHKFSYNFKTTDELKLDAQLPKYKKALVQLGYPVNHIVFNQIRTREIKSPSPSDLFRRSESMATDRSVDTIWAEQIETIKLIQESRPPVRALAPMVCKGCWFKDPCTALMDGQDITTMLKAQYEKRERPLKELYSD